MAKITYELTLIANNQERTATLECEREIVPRIGEDVEYAEDWAGQEVSWVHHNLDGSVFIRLKYLTMNTVHDAENYERDMLAAGWKFS